MEFVTIGKIIKPQGVKGEVKVYLYAQNPKFLESTKSFFAVKQNKELKAKTVSIRHGFGFILFEGIASRNEAELLRGLELYVKKDEFEKASDGTFLIEDLIGLNLYNQKGEELGELIDIEQYGSADVWVYRGKGRTYSFPYINDIVKNVDVSAKRIVVDEEKLKEARIWKLMF